MAEINEEIPSNNQNGVIRHSRTSSSTSSTSNEECLVLSVAGLQGKSANNSTKRPNSGNNNTKINIETENAQLRSELEQVKQQLKTKDDEINKLGKIRNELEEEVQELTASLFEEAHKMVGEANVRAAASERNLEEAEMKVEGLETEVAALKDMVLTSTPSKPNRHLHPQLGDPKKRGNQSGLDVSSNSSLLSLSETEKIEEKYVDPVLKNEYMAWKKCPTLDKKSSPFLKRLYEEDFIPCLTFPNESLTVKVRQAVENNSVSMSPIVMPKENSSNCEMPRNCALFEAPS